MLSLDDALTELRAITDGIDRDEADGGWWETTAGALFGARKLHEIEQLLHRICGS